MKNFLLVFFLFFSIGLFAQKNNDSTQKTENLKDEIVSLKKTVSSLNHKFNTFKYSQKKTISKQNKKFDKISSNAISSANDIKNNSDSISKINTDIELLKKENEDLKQLISDKCSTYKLSLFILLFLLIILFLFNRISIFKLPKKMNKTIVETKQDADLEIQSVKIELSKEVKNIKKSINKINKDIKSLSEKE